MALNLSPVDIIGAYSLDENRQYQHGMKNIKYLRIPSEPNFDLNKGAYVDKPAREPRERINQLTHFIMDNKDVMISKQEKRVIADIVCFRGVLRYLMASPYNRDRPWTLDAVKFKNTIYMSLVDDNEEPDQAQTFELDPVGKKFSEFGFKFETYILADHPDGEPKGCSEPVKEAEEFCVVMSRMFNNLKVVFGIETDGVESGKPIKTVEELRKVPLVEVKTRVHAITAKQKDTLIKKSLDWYCQSFVSNTDKIYVGYRDVRDNKQIVDKVKPFYIEHGATEARKKGFWNADKCQMFMMSFLQRIYREMKAVDSPTNVFRYRLDCNSKEVYSVGVKAYDFLPKDFIDFMNKT